MYHIIGGYFKEKQPKNKKLYSLGAIIFNIK